MDNQTISNLEQSKGIKIMHMNVRSLINKIDQMRLLFDNSKIDVLTLSETWAKDYMNTHLLSIKSYDIIRQDRDLTSTNKKRGGGLLTLIKSGKFTEHTHLDKLSTSNSNVEALWTKLGRCKAKDLVICNLYRPSSGNLDSMLKYLNTCIKTINRAKTCISWAI